MRHFTHSLPLSLIHTLTYSLPFSFSLSLSLSLSSRPAVSEWVPARTPRHPGVAWVNDLRAAVCVWSWLQLKEHRVLFSVEEDASASRLRVHDCSAWFWSSSRIEVAVYVLWWSHVFCLWQGRGFTFIPAGWQHLSRLDSSLRSALFSQSRIKQVYLPWHSNNSITYEMTCLFGASL